MYCLCAFKKSNYIFFEFLDLMGVRPGLLLISTAPSGDPTAGVVLPPARHGQCPQKQQHAVVSCWCLCCGARKRVARPARAPALLVVLCEEAVIPASASQGIMGRESNLLVTCSLLSVLPQPKSYSHRVQNTCARKSTFLPFVK